MEVAQYGDTEIPASELKATVEKLKSCEKENVRCKMEDDFEVNAFTFNIIICFVCILLM